MNDAAVAPETAVNDPDDDAPTAHTHDTPETAPSGSVSDAVNSVPASGSPEIDTLPTSLRLLTVTVNTNVSSITASTTPAASLLSDTR